MRPSLELGAPEDEEIFLPRMPVDIDEEVNLAALESLLDHVLHAVDLRRDAHVWVQPLPVEVISTKAASIIADDHTIRVEHRDNLENVLFAQ